MVEPSSRAAQKLAARGNNRWSWVLPHSKGCMRTVSLARASKREVTLCPAPIPSTFESLVVYEPSKCLMAFSFDIRDGNAASTKIQFLATNYGMGCPDGKGASPQVLSQLGEITAVEGNKLSSGIAPSLKGEAIPTTGGTFECRDKYNRVIGAFWMPDVKAGMDVGWTHFAGRDGIQVGKVKVSRDRVRNYCASLFLRGQQIYQTLTETATKVPGNSKEAPRTPLYAPYLGSPVDDGCFHGTASEVRMAFEPVADDLEFALCDHTLEIKHGECSLTYPNLRWFSQHSDLKELTKDVEKQALVMKTIMEAVNSDEFGSVCIDARGEKAIRQSIKKSVGTATLSDNEDDKKMVNVGCTETNVNARDGGAVASTYTVPKMDKLHSPLTYYNGFRSAFTRDKTLARKFCALVLERRHVISTALDNAFPHGDYDVVRTEA